MSADCPASFPEGRRKLWLCRVCGCCMWDIVCPAQVPLCWRSCPCPGSAGGPLRDCLSCRVSSYPRAVLPRGLHPVTDPRKGYEVLPAQPCWVTSAGSVSLQLSPHGVAVAGLHHSSACSLPSLPVPSPCVDLKSTPHETPRMLTCIWESAF